MTDVKENCEALALAMQSDAELAWAWHCNVAMAYQDEGGGHEAANRAAARFMASAFGVDVTQLPQWRTFEQQWEEDDARRSPAKRVAARFNACQDELYSFTRVVNKRSSRPDLHAFLLLDALFPRPRYGIIKVTGSVILDRKINAQKLATLSDAQILELVRCGLGYDEEIDALVLVQA